MTTFTWTINSLITLPQEGGETDVVVDAVYTLTGVDGDTTADFSAHQQFTYTGGAFTPFDQLTEQQVIGWVQDALGPVGVSNVEATVQSQIDAKKNPAPQPQNSPLPWAEQPGS